MNYYKLLKINSIVKNPRIKFLGLYFLHKLNKRYLAVYFDPVNACNLRCKMCYFSNKEYAAKAKGVFKAEDLPLLAKAIFPRALKVQVGCGAEPTLYKDLNAIFKLAAEYKAPYVSLTTNANNIEKSDLEQWALSGLNEITVSLHGVYEETYREMMRQGDYERFMKSLEYVTDIKKRFPEFKLRVNYTFNEHNFDELADFWQVFSNIDIDILQIRPITKIGDSEYDHFSLESIIPKYEAIYNKLIAESQKKRRAFDCAIYRAINAKRKLKRGY